MAQSGRNTKTRAVARVRTERRGDGFDHLRDVGSCPCHGHCALMHSNECYGPIRRKGGSND